MMYSRMFPTIRLLTCALNITYHIYGMSYWSYRICSFVIHSTTGNIMPLFVPLNYESPQPAYAAKSMRVVEILPQTKHGFVQLSQLPPLNE